MRNGYFDEGDACLRMKADYHSDNPNMWDHVAYHNYLTSHIPQCAWCDHWDVLSNVLIIPIVLSILLNGSLSHVATS